MTPFLPCCEQGYPQIVWVTPQLKRKGAEKRPVEGLLIIYAGYRPILAESLRIRSHVFFA